MRFVSLAGNTTLCERIRRVKYFRSVFNSPLATYTDKKLSSV